ncbi:hypothetical protein F5884DRAFT_103455 [Xylogone sp. PMI_703]|nr:hypothetical protein F5884DRAFT_103455 [Xylogone sp. PMI_703]
MDTIGVPPSEIAKARELLFALPVPFSLTKANYDLYWKFIDNVYTVKKTMSVKVGNPHISKYVDCRFKRAYAKPATRPTKRVKPSCDVSFKLLIFPDHVAFYSLEDHPTNHNHSLDDSDQGKRNSWVRELAHSEYVKGHSAAAIISMLYPAGNPFAREQMDAVGGRFLTRQDIINSGASWRLARERARVPEMRIATEKMLENIRTRMIEVTDYADSMEDAETRDQILRKWEEGMADFSKNFIGDSLAEWLNAHIPNPELEYSLQ